MALIDLPPKYYLGHFLELISDLSRYQDQFLDEEHVRFLQDFHQLEEDAQCLLIRMLNRKGSLFAKESLSYAEITQAEAAFKELEAKKFTRGFEPRDLEAYLQWIKKDRIIELLSRHGIPYKKSFSREKLLGLLKSSEQPIVPDENLVLLERLDEIDYLLFLYFGKVQDSLVLYTLRDLGIRQTNKKKAFMPKFESKDEAKAQFFYACLRSHGEYALEDIPSWPHPLNMESKLIREKILLHLSEWYKEEGSEEKALETLFHCSFHPGSEKLVRLLQQAGRKEEAQARLRAMMDEPSCMEELLFAEDFLERKFGQRKISTLTQTLRDAQKIMIDESFYRHPEFGVLEHYKAQGVNGHFVENYLWATLFGVVFWEELFEQDHTHNEFEILPSSLKARSFHTKHRESIERKLSELEDHPRIIAKAQELFVEHGTRSNGIFGWHESTFTMLEDFLSHASATSVAAILRYMAEDYFNRHTGFPDLLIFSGTKPVFIEIKAEGDSLKAAQLKQMKMLERAGFEVKILQVGYLFNPEQTYVVVDLETTGTLASYNRITEIGAIKVRGGEVIDRFQTLVNPQRSIPRNIQDLTGISNSMVARAPKFAEISEKFEEFCEGAIFVAHNVAFDYGFIQAEFARLEKRFVRPYICTKAGMRKHYPGLDSYGLKNLSLHFSINLTQHHRALSDAEAAAGLLKLINQSRFEKHQKELSMDSYDQSADS
jgi:DNA polymerase-3 subunit epsilon